jgi:hypothetical protein
VNGTPPQIEIIAPFRAAFEWMKSVLFRPFDVTKWLTIAFAAFIGGNMGGGGGNFSRIGRLGNGDWKYRTTSHGNWPSDWNITPWLIALIVMGVLVFLVIAVVWAWVSARGRFIFTDCVVKNRGAIGEPWREYRREGNSFFLFWLAIGFVTLILAGIVVAILVSLFRMGDFNEPGPSVMFVVVLVLAILVWVIVALFLTIVAHFMVPVMYRRRCTAREAFADVLSLILRNPGPIILFVLFMIVLAIAVAVVGTMVACLTCCIGGLPYISTVLLLPAIVWLAAYRLLFLRQFGDQYDVWATTPPPTTLPPATAPPA